MYDFYDKPIVGKLLETMQARLHELYAKVPSTTGCLENIESGEKCGSWCCEIQQPSLLYSEFLLSWQHVLKNWSKADILLIVERCIQQYFDSKPTNGCVFWNVETKKCMQHETRPLACRIYGQEPEETFKPKYERLKVLYQGNKQAKICQQCSLVKTEGKPPTKEDIDNWHKEVQRIDNLIGISESLSNDKEGGAYRTYKDHILLKISTPELLASLTDTKKRGNKHEQKQFIKNFIEELWSQKE